ncbi:hypothetical protein SteCoe_10972 [Stentor coeruleus]|uniref:Uncharacterized protein n=1 Tax=Stentor coeruleus TaxID=5963 RepID=A0A1R2CEC2_9CILI|nr:hypothetical protein SteCoe_10972 [Stentor coeruleus]
MGNVGMARIDEKKGSIRNTETLEDKVKYFYVGRVEPSAPRNDTSPLKTFELLHNTQNLCGKDRDDKNLGGSKKSGLKRSKNMSNARILEREVKRTNSECTVLPCLKVKSLSKNLTERLPPIKNKSRAIKSIIDDLRQKNTKNSYF